MTDLERYEGPERGWLTLMVPAADLAKQIAETDFVPKAYRGKPAAIAAAILYGDEVGIGPMQSLARIHVIDGKPALAAETQRALILSAGHDLWQDEATNTRVTWVGRRRGSDQSVRVTWTMDDAKAAGLAGRGPWRSYPRAMLSARASAELARAMFADCIGGMAAVEEIEDGWDVEPAPTNGEAAPAPAKATRTRKRAARGKAAGQAPPADRARGPEAIEASATERADLPPLPGDEGFDQQAPDRLPNGWPSIAIAAKEAGLDDDGRHAIAYLASKGRVRSSRDLIGPETAQARAWLEAIGRGELRLVIDSGGRFLRLVDVGNGVTIAQGGWEPSGKTAAETGSTRPSAQPPAEPAPGSAGERPAASPSPGGMPTDADGWKAAGAAVGRRQPTILRRAREIAEQAGIDPPPDLDSVPGGAVSAALWNWLQEQAQ